MQLLYGPHCRCFCIDVGPAGGSHATEKMNKAAAQQTTLKGPVFPLSLRVPSRTAQTSRLMMFDQLEHASPVVWPIGRWPLAAPHEDWRARAPRARNGSWEPSPSRSLSSALV